jgi:hypothetical protein
MATLLQEAAQLVTEDPSLGELIDNALDVSDNATVVSIADAPVNTTPQTEVLVDILDGGTSIVGFNNISNSVPVTTTLLVQPLVPDAVVAASTEVTETAVTDVSTPQIALPAAPITAPVAAPPVMGILLGDEVFVDPLLDTVPVDGFVDPLLDIAPLDPSILPGDEVFVDPLLDTVPVDGFVDPLLDIVPIEEVVPTRPLTLEGVVEESPTPPTGGARLAGPAFLGIAPMIDVPPVDGDPLLDIVPADGFVDPLVDIIQVDEATVIEEVVFTKPLTLDGVAVPTDTTVMNGDGAVVPEGTFDPCTCWAAPLTDPIGSGSAVDPAAPPVLLADYAAPTGFIVDYAAPPVL